MGAVVSFLWPKNAAALNHYLQRVPSKVYSPQSLAASVRPESLQVIQTEAEARANNVGSAMQGSADTRGAIVTAGLAEKLTESMVLIDGLDRAHAQDGVELVVLNEDVMQHSKTAALWAKSRGVPAVVVSHSSVLGRLYTVHREDNGAHLAVFGKRGAQPYLDMGVPAAKISATGNPAWDVYAQLPAQRDALRAELKARHGFAPRDHIVVFATTWPAFFTAFCDADHYETSLRAVLRSIRELRELGVPVQLVIKERPSNEGKRESRERIIREEAAGFTPVVTPDDLEKWIVAADVLISVDSNVSIEASLAGTVAINLWSASSWLNGPFFGAHDGVLETSEQSLSMTLVHALGNEEMRTALRAQARGGSPEFASFVGSAAARVGELMVQSRKPVEPKAARYVWQELSDPRSVTEKGVDSVYYRNARTDMIARLRRAPALMLDVGCGAAATGAAIKQLYPGATVVGVEMNAEAAAMASGRVDRVIVANVETMDFAEHGFAPGSIDLVFFPDVLEHLYDPWKLLVRLKPFLTKDAQVLASIPNARNLWLLSHVIGGDWQYAEEGLLDVTHIRFFTKKTVLELFTQTGYAVQSMHSNADGRVPAMQAPEKGTVNVDMQRMLLKNMSAEDLIELRTLQFVVDATPLPTL